MRIVQGPGLEILETFPRSWKKDVHACPLGICNNGFAHMLGSIPLFPSISFSVFHGTAANQMSDSHA